MSFFKRLSYKKGQPVAQWEDIIFAVRQGESKTATITSPPYQEEKQGGNTGVFVTKPSRLIHKEGYGQTPGQIGNMKDRV